jgi:hypothetical protein
MFFFVTGVGKGKGADAHCAALAKAAVATKYCFAAD